MDVVSGNREHLRHDLYYKIAHYRHQVFVERLGWPLETRHRIELDQFDRTDTVYVVAKNDHQQIVGCARLLPTTRPYLLAEVFPDLLNGSPPPRTNDVWELSRFCAVDLNRPLPRKPKQFSSSIAVTLLRESLIRAAAYGARRLITVSPLGVERLLIRAGFHAHRAGPPAVIDGNPFFACWIEIE